MFKKSRQIFRIIFPRAYDPEANFIARLENNRMIEIHLQNIKIENFILLENRKLSIALNKKNSTNEHYS